MKKKLTKYDFLAINRRMNNNFNGGWQFRVGPAYNTTKGELLKTDRKLHKTKKGKK